MTTNKNNHPDGLFSPPPQLPTSRAAHEQERGVLSLLRNLTPKRPLSLEEAQRVAELQANVLLRQAGRPEPPIDSEIVAQLPRVRVRLDENLPASGSAHWQNGYWVITLNASEPWTRRRFTLAHEFKHIIDHPHTALVHSSNTQRAEHVADYFAACLLMPKREVKQLWGQQCQGLAELAAAFAVSQPAMARRLVHLGLREAGHRGGNRFPVQTDTGPITYYRARRALVGSAS